MEDQQWYEEFARRVRRRRQACGRTQKAVAVEIAMHPPQYSRFESGAARLVDLAQIPKLAQALSTSADYLFGLSEDAGPIPPELRQEEALTLAGTTPLRATILYYQYS